MKKVIAIGSIIFLAGCSTMQPPRYSISVDNVQAIKKFNDTKLTVSNFTQTASFSSNCRLMGPIEPADGLSIPQFIGKAFNDELKMADAYSESGTQISGNVTEIGFSSMTGLTNGNWHISISLTSSNGNTLDVSNKHEFKSGFDAITACNAAADALSPAGQDLIQAAVTDPKFRDLL